MNQKIAISLLGLCFSLASFAQEASTEERIQSCLEQDESIQKICLNKLYQEKDQALKSLIEYFERLD